jgi:hypothetical protein
MGEQREAMMKKSILLLATLVTAWAVADTRAGDKQPDEVTLRDAEVGDVAKVLGIAKRSGEFKLSRQAKSWGVRFDFYNGGKKSRSMVGGRLTHNDPQPAAGRFAVVAVDLDYLSLKGGKPGHCRVLVDLATRGGTIQATEDIPKAVFDFSKVAGSGSFDRSGDTKSEVPLFWMVANRNEIRAGGTLADMVKDNEAKGSLLVVTLVLE